MNNKKALKVSPRGVRVSSQLGYRIHPITGNRKMHNGIDIATKEGTPIRSVVDGVVSQNDHKSNGNGNRIAIQNINMEYHHLHMQERSHLPVGTKVKRGDIIGFVGNTGGSKGAHLHFETHFKGAVQKPLDSHITAHLNNFSRHHGDKGNWTSSNGNFTFSLQDENRGKWVTINGRHVFIKS
jgi:murein DD-endopeptidase MepM/ murein hydrolase activator NlpD